MIKKFDSFLNVKISRFIDETTKNQIVGAFVIFKVSQDIVDKISENSDFPDASFMITVDKQIYCTIKTFLYTNNVHVLDTITESIAYIDVYMKTQLLKYNIAESDYIYDRDVSLFGLFSGKAESPINSDNAKQIGLLSIKKQSSTTKVMQPSVEQIKPEVQTSSSKQIKEKPVAKETEYEKEAKNLEHDLHEGKVEGEHIFKKAVSDFLMDVAFGKSRKEKAIKKQQEEEKSMLDKKNRMLKIEEEKDKLIKSRLELKKSKLPKADKPEDLG